MEVKFFDASWHEVAPENAVYAVQLEFDDEGNLIGSMTFDAVRQEQKYGRFVTIDDRIVFIGGPRQGAGGARAGAGAGRLPAAKFDPSIKNDGMADIFLDAGLPFGWDKATMAQRSEVKAEIVKGLAEETGLPEEDVNAFIKQWAHTSNDNDMRSLGIQQDASAMFGAELSEWQQGKINTRAEEIEKYPAAASSPVSQPLLPRSSQLKLLNAMYDRTQKQLEEAGVPDVVTLYRGLKQSAGTKGEIVNIHSNTLASWSAGTRTARSFASNSGSVLQIQIPRSRIMGSARTGFGCLDEGEFVIVGNNYGSGDEVLVMP